MTNIVAPVVAGAVAGAALLIAFGYSSLLPPAEFDRSKVEVVVRDDVSQQYLTEEAVERVVEKTLREQVTRNFLE